MHVLSEDVDCVWMIVMEESVAHARSSCGGQMGAGVGHGMGLCVLGSDMVVVI